MSDEELDVLLTLDDPPHGPEEDTFHHLQPDTKQPDQLDSIKEEYNEQIAEGLR